MKKIIYIVLDGLGDNPIKELNNKTPLEAALTPHMDSLAKEGKVGLVYPVGKGIVPESDTAVISLLGYDVKKYYTGRGPLEAFAEGITVSEGNVALRVNFASLGEDGKTISDRRVGRTLTQEETDGFAKEINSKISLSSATFEFVNTVGHRGVLVLRPMHNKLSPWITNTDSAYGRHGIFGVTRERCDNYLLQSVPMRGHENSFDAKETALILNEFTQKSLKVLSESYINKKRISEGKLAANAILSRDAGSSLPKFPNVQSLYRLSFGAFVEMPVERGIALLTGMEIIEVPNKTGHLDVDYAVWAKIALDAIDKFDCLYVHIKGPDEPSHDGDFKKKIEIIELIDKFYFGSLLSSLNMKETVVAVTADHSTVCATSTHSSGPVPLLISGGNNKPDKISSFSERSADKGSLGKVLGNSLLPLLVKLAK
ncbi:MAG: alkaline phosphatase family protein [Candidatus Omnitrophica bacterium]|nr:alkaline phosphatase family protein [Candidatus Omnitrophota bacterium]